MAANTGGPAFPQRSTDSNGDLYEPGMTLRDYFAAKAMQGFAADPTVGGSHEQLSEAAYKWADAMIAERSK